MAVRRVAGEGGEDTLSPQREGGQGELKLYSTDIPPQGSVHSLENHCCKQWGVTEVS